MTACLTWARGFRARIRFLDASEGGRHRYASADGYSPQLQLGSVLTSVRLVKMDGDQVAVHDDLLPGETYDLFVVVQFADHYPEEHLDPADIKLLEGPRVVAVGEAIGPVYEPAPHQSWPSPMQG